ncbi:MAG: helix-turn-helix domain-containing protein [Deltaproteobacteria bacterium]|jgi:transcriptional regulator with XRE-family HTH domain|nr:helix-turn-helix domain-containing protein [Deltaproteobacteria bacterium]
MNPAPLNKQVGQAIARQRKLANLTQAQVAEQLGIENETVSRHETGASPPNLARLEQFSRLFGCPVIRFFEEQHSDESLVLLQTLVDLLQSLETDEKSLLVNFIANGARMFKNRRFNAN